MKTDLEAAVAKAGRLYYSYTGQRPAGVRVEVACNISRRCIELAQSGEEKRRCEKSRKILSGLKGTVVWPVRLADRPVVLIDKTTFQRKEDGVFYSTLAHEFAHIQDFYAFAQKHGYRNPLDVQKDEQFTVFYFWTEFHARRVGYGIYRQLIVADRPQSTEVQIRHIAEREIPFQLGMLRDGLKEYAGKNEPLLYMYELIQFLARYSVWNDLFSSRFSTAFFPQKLTGVFGEKILDLYAYLHAHQDFESFFASLFELRRLADSFTGDFEQKKTFI